MPKGKKKGKASQKRKRANSGQFLSTKKPKNETPTIENVANETTTKESHVDEEKTIELQAPNNKVEYLDTPVKSIYDKKEYRVIKLQNGLKALLISVPNIPRTEGEQESDSEDLLEDIEQAVFKPRDSRFEEGIRASCGLCIDVGKFSDPPGIPRASEYLERMVTNGCAKFPKRDNWIFKACCGGRFKNSTQSDQTIFTITAVEEYSLVEALDWIAQFFISPLMKREDVPSIREKVEEVNRGDYVYLRDLESNRKAELFRSLARPGHPATKLRYSNSVTQRKLRDDRLYEEIIKFKERHYSAHRMTAVIEAKFPLDTLEKYAIKCFSSIPSNGLPPDDFSKFKGVDPYDRPGNSKIYRMTVYKNKFNIEMRWTMPPLHEHYRTKPHHYLARILQHEGKGSLFSYLEKKKWCIDISSGVGKDSFENNSLYTTFILYLTVTEEGNKHLWQVIDAVYAYIDVMKKEGPQKRIYDEIQKVAEKSFRFRPKTLNEDIFELCTVASLYPPADYITGRALYFDYDPDAIKACTDLLTPDRAKIIYLECGETYWDSSEPEVVNSPDAWIHRWKTVAPIPELHLPEANAFITEDYPVKIHEDEFSEIWLKSYRKYVDDESYLKIQYITPLPFTSKNNLNNLNLFVSILKNLCEKLHYTCEIHLAPNGLWVGAENYSPGLLFFMKTITILITQYWHLLTEDLFDEAKQTILKSYCIQLKNPTMMAEDLKDAMIHPVNWTRADLYASLRDLQFDEFREFVKIFTDHMRIRCFVQGNMRTADIIETTQKCVEILNCQPLSPNAILPNGNNRLPHAVHCCRIKSFDRSCHDSVVLNVYQFGAPSAKLAAVIDIFCGFTMGYSHEGEFLVAKCMSGQFGYSITSKAIQSKSVEEIDERIEDFRNYVNKAFNEMSTTDLQNVKKFVIEASTKEWAELDSDLEKKAEANWNTIMENKYDFNEAQRRLDLIDAITVEELRTSMMQLSMNVNTRRFSKLSIQIVGHGDLMKKSTNASARTVSGNTKESTEYTVKYLTRLPKDKKNRARNYYITDYQKFKRGLKFCPMERFSM